MRAYEEYQQQENVLPANSKEWLFFLQEYFFVFMKDPWYSVDLVNQWGTKGAFRALSMAQLATRYHNLGDPIVLMYKNIIFNLRMIPSVSVLEMAPRDSSQSLQGIPPPISAMTVLDTFTPDPSDDPKKPSSHTETQVFSVRAKSKAFLDWYLVELFASGEVTIVNPSRIEIPMDSDDESSDSSSKLHEYSSDSDEYK